MKAFLNGLILIILLIVYLINQAAAIFLAVYVSLILLSPTIARFLSHNFKGKVK